MTMGWTAQELTDRLRHRSIHVVKRRPNLKQNSTSPEPAFAVFGLLVSVRLLCMATHKVEAAKAIAMFAIGDKA